MPWKGEKDPYRIWLSEIILQQTRVEQGISYYEKFISGFPTIKALAKASEKEVFKYWEGLGYYSRCKNLIASAKIIAGEYKGVFPSSYDEILALPGVGPYTAAAISSFAFNLPYAVVDGNVERILARYFGISIPKSSASGKKIYADLAFSLLDKNNPGNFNQAIMDFGATVCKPQNPLCTTCPLSKNCESNKYGWTGILPQKKVAPPRKTRWLYYFIIDAGKSKYWIRKRTENDIWQHLYEFVLLETGQLIPHDKIPDVSLIKEKLGKTGFQISHISPIFSQTLTHQSIKGCFIHVKPSIPMVKLSGYQPVALSKLRDFPFPKLISDYLGLLNSE